MKNTSCKLGVIGFGLRAETLCRNFLEGELPVSVCAVADIDRENARKHLCAAGFSPEDVRFYHEPLRMLQEESLDGIFIGTNCESHATLICLAAPFGLPLFLEKPVCTDEAQWRQLHGLCRAKAPQAVISFPLRLSPLCQEAKKILDSGKLGTLSQIQAVNNVSYGQVYYRSWYRDEIRTGGLFLQKATHDIDLIQYLLNELPVLVAAMESKTVYKGGRPAGLHCPECDEYRTCPESTFSMRTRQKEPVNEENCVFAEDTGNHDSASILLQFGSGVHAVYTQNFVARRTAAKRCVRIIGHEASLEFDFITASLRLISHHTDTVLTQQVGTLGLSHYGGDRALAENFVTVMQQRGDSASPLAAGMESALTCLMAKQSADRHQFVHRHSFLP